MNTFRMLLLGAAVLPASLLAQETNDSTATDNYLESTLDELVVIAPKEVLKQAPDRIVYTVRNDPYAAGLDGKQLLDRIPRVSVVNDAVSVAGKNSVRYIVDGHLLEMTDEAISLKLKNMQADGIEKIELLTTPPAKYAAANNVAYISITTRNESLGTRGNVWGRVSYSHDFRYSLGGNVSHTTRKVELSVDASGDCFKGLMDSGREQIFPDYTITSDRTNRFSGQNFGANGLFKYKFNKNWSTGVIINYSLNRSKADQQDMTVIHETPTFSSVVTPWYPQNAVTLTGFADWIIDPSGKTLSLTYNWFDRRSNLFSDIRSGLQSLNLPGDDFGSCRLTREARNRYDIHSVKLDAVLPFSGFKLEAGAAYTWVRTRTGLHIANDLDGILVDDPTQSNDFDYTEKTTAVYVSAEKSLAGNLFGKIGLRYEFTDLNGIRKDDDIRHHRSYGYLFPSAVISWNIPRGGRLSADYSMGITRPNMGDLNPFRYYNTATDYFTGNPDLKPTISNNVGLNYSFKGLYAVVYGSWNRDVMGYITRFEPDGSQWSTPENCINTTKVGLYASYNRSLFGWWNLNVGGEIFYSTSESNREYFKDTDRGDWSGKLELNTSWMLNRPKTLIFNVRCTHMFPYQDKMLRFKSMTLLNAELRYQLLDNRLSLAASVSDPFKWIKTKYEAEYSDYTLRQVTDIHNHSISLRVAYTFGASKVNQVYRDTKERESQRTY